MKQTISASYLEVTKLEAKVERYEAALRLIADSPTLGWGALKAVARDTLEQQGGG